MMKLNYSAVRLTVGKEVCNGIVGCFKITGAGIVAI